MQSGIRIGSLFGIPLQIHPSWLIILSLLTVSNGLEWQVAYSAWGSTTAWVVGFTAAVLLFVSVLLHELGHSLTARAQGIRVNSITLFLFGGVAAIDRESKSPGQAFWVAIAGPAVSILLAIALLVVAPFLPPTSPAEVLVADLARINLILALFNLIPGLPLDGGQIFKAAIWKATGDRFKAVRWASRSGMILGWAAVLLGVVLVFATDNPGGFWLSLLGWFGIRNAQSYNQLTIIQEGLVKTTAKDTMTRHYRVLDGNLTVEAFIELYFQTSAKDTTPYFCATDGRYDGAIEVSTIQSLERSQWQLRKLREFAQPLTDIATVTEETSALEIIQRMESENLSYITVLSPAGAVAGVIDRGDLVRSVGATLSVQFPSEEIERVKQDRAFPPKFQLGAIAQATDVEPAATEQATTKATADITS